MNKYHKIFNRSTRRTGGPSPPTAPRVLRVLRTCGTTLTKSHHVQLCMATKHATKHAVITLTSQLA